MYTHCSDNEKQNPKNPLDDKAYEKAPKKTPVYDKKKQPAPEIEHLPLGTDYEVEHLPTEVIKPEIQPVKEDIPDLVKEKKLEDFKLEDPEPSPDDPIPSIEDEFYDFDKDIYGDETSLKSDL